LLSSAVIVPVITTVPVPESSADVLVLLLLRGIK
jgi:hypothetical protein